MEIRLSNLARQDKKLRWSLCGTMYKIPRVEVRLPVLACHEVVLKTVHHHSCIGNSSTAILRFAIRDFRFSISVFRFSSTFFRCVIWLVSEDRVWDPNRVASRCLRGAETDGSRVWKTLTLAICVDTYRHVCGVTYYV